SEDPCHTTILAGTSALQCKGGIIGGAAGVANDTILTGVYIPLHATAATLTIGGFLDSTGSPANWVLSGQTTIDQFFEFKPGMLNDAGALTFTPSVAGIIVAFTHAFAGG